jgi:hypothetical protein
MSKHASISALFRFMLHALRPSFIDSWSISHILEHEIFCLGWAAQGSKEKKRKLEYFLATFEDVFFSLSWV